MKRLTKALGVVVCLVLALSSLALAKDDWRILCETESTIFFLNLGSFECVKLGEAGGVATIEANYFDKRVSQYTKRHLLAFDLLHHTYRMLFPGMGWTPWEPIKPNTVLWIAYEAVRLMAIGEAIDI